MYQALYRKYRPKDFDSVVGQSAIIKTLRNSIAHNNFSHAYLFFGPRGTGKTTISKILARDINCLNPNDGLACGKCDNCLVSFSKDCVDILEIDAASNNGVDEIRELKNRINLVPNELKYKVYIIDEVHMLSIGAFNALLKTLEEPPEHAIFILATTDPQKVPETIISRCQCFSFQKLSNSIIVNHLKDVCKSEKIKIDDEVLENIAIFSDGGMRDALGLLDKLVSFTDKKITMNDFVEINGIISDEQIRLFIQSIMNSDVSSVLNIINDFDSSGKNLIQVILQIINYLRNLLVDYFLNHNSFEYSYDLIQDLVNLLNEKMFDIKKSDNPRIYLEMLLLKFIHDHINNVNTNTHTHTNTNTNSLQDTNNSINIISNVDIKNEGNSENNDNASDDEFDFSKEFSDNDDNFDLDNSDEDTIQSYPKILNIDEIMKVRINNTLALANKDLLKQEVGKFDLLKDFTFDQEIGYLVCSLLDSKVRVVSEENIIISYDNDANVKQNLSILDKITDVYHKITKSDKNFAIISDEEWNKIKNEYIANLKNGISYKVEEEPKVILEEIKNNDIIVNSAVELFGDIVEIN